MPRFRFVPLLPLLGVLLCCSGGCGSGAGSVPTSGPELFNHTALQETGESYNLAIQDNKKPPESAAALAKYRAAFSAGFQEISSGNVVVLWGAPLSDTSANAVLAYEKTTPVSGGYVLMQDGKTIKKMTAEEFRSAPKAPGKAETAAK